jgi:hypothetical protein
MTLHPNRLQNLQTRSMAAGRLGLPGVTKQLARSSRSSRAASMPRSSDPAIGWDPTYETDVGSVLDAHCRTTTFVDPTSVTTHPLGRLGPMPLRTASNMHTGVARMTNCACTTLAARSPETFPTTPRHRTFLRVSARWANAVTSTRGNRLATAMATEPPSNPRPTIVTLCKSLNNMDLER